MTLPNNPAAPNAAIAPQFQFDHYERGVGEPGR